MENLFGTIGRKDPSYLLASNVLTDAIGISVEPGNGIIPAGAVMYRKSGVLYAPAGTSNIATSNNLVVLRDDVDSDSNDAIAVAAAAYRKGTFIAGKVLYLDSTYKPVTSAHAIVLRMQGIDFSPMDDWNDDAVEADNRLALSVTVTAGSNGSATADKNTAKKGETVTVTVTPSAGYELDEIEATDGGVTLTKNEDDTYSFVMGEEEVEIEVTFKAEG